MWTTGYHCSKQRALKSEESALRAKRPVDFFFSFSSFFFFNPSALYPRTSYTRPTNHNLGVRRMNCANLSRQEKSVSVAGVAAFCAGHRGMFSIHCEKGRAGGREGGGDGEKKRQKVPRKRRKIKDIRGENFSGCRIAASLFKESIFLKDHK